MSLAFPSSDFDEAVAGACHGTGTMEQMRALNELLRANPGARDEYLLRVELHARLASDPELFARMDAAHLNCRLADMPSRSSPKHAAASPPGHGQRTRLGPILAIAACLGLLAVGGWAFWLKRSGTFHNSTSNAVAMLTRTVDAQWVAGTESTHAGSPLRSGWLRLHSGMAQLVFYSGARVVIEGPAELQLISPSEAMCRSGRLLVEVPEPARGFRIQTPQLNLVDLGTAFGVNATRDQTEVHVFQGNVELTTDRRPAQTLGETQAAVVAGRTPIQLMAADATDFASMFEFQQRSIAAEAIRYEQWQFTNARLREDPSLIVHLDLQNLSATDWTMRNSAAHQLPDLEGVIIGCARTQGRWREKQALEFQSVNDRVRIAVPGEYDSLTLTAWVCIFGLDQPFNSLLMCDGFAPGTIHWLVRDDGVLGVTVFGDRPGRFQILRSPPVVTRNDLGRWLHIAVVLDRRIGRVVHYLNGTPVSRHELDFNIPFRIGAAEFGNWNARSGAKPGPAMIRNLRGALDELALFKRALSDGEIEELYASGKP